MVAVTAVMWMLVMYEHQRSQVYREPVVMVAVTAVMWMLVMYEHQRSQVYRVPVVMVAVTAVMWMSVMYEHQRSQVYRVPVVMVIVMAETWMTSGARHTDMWELMLRSIDDQKVPEGKEAGEGFEWVTRAPERWFFSKVHPPPS
ncbi:hypothetical protein J6590_056940 [Homalodisca vitripennis]|nr:hypothetical protein J6590_056940 [Homalodisca vitripennis]